VNSGSEQTPTPCADLRARAEARVVTPPEAVRLGLTGPEAPPPVRCEHCGRTIEPLGITSLCGENRVILWLREYERCACPEALLMWEARDREEARRKVREEEDRRNARMAAQVERLFSDSGVRARFRDRTFATFREDAANAEAFRTMQAYAADFRSCLPRTDGRGRVCAPERIRNGIYLTGGYGVGKTHLAVSVANELLGRGIAVVCMTMIDLLDRIKQSWDEGEDDESQLLRAYREVPLLILDDLGSEQPTEWGLARLFGILNARYEAYMPTIVTTNYGADELIRRMTPKSAGGPPDQKTPEKIVDRLTEMCVGLFIGGRSRRRTQ